MNVAQYDAWYESPLGTACLAAEMSQRVEWIESNAVALP